MQEVKEMILFPRSNEPSASLLAFGGCREGQIPRPSGGELAKKKLSHAPLLAAGYLTYSVCGVLFAFYISNSTGTI
jgi:hypothetical protein